MMSLIISTCLSIRSIHIYLEEINAIAERMNGILKSEFDLYVSQQNLAETQQRIARSIAAYSQIRPHDSCDRLTPEKAHLQMEPYENDGRAKININTTCIVPKE